MRIIFGKEPVKCPPGRGPGGRGEALGTGSGRLRGRALGGSGAGLWEAPGEPGYIIKKIGNFFKNEYKKSKLKLKLSKRRREEILRSDKRKGRGEGIRGPHPFILKKDKHGSHDNI